MSDVITSKEPYQGMRGNPRLLRAGMPPIPLLFVIDEMEAITAGGTERQLLQIIGMLAGSEFAPELAIFRGTTWLTEQQAGCPIIPLGVQRLFSIRGMRGLSRLAVYIRRRRFPIVQSFFVESNLVVPPIARLAGVKVIIGSRRNLNHWMGNAFAVAQWVSNLFVTRLQANSLAVKNTVTRMERVSADKLDVFYNGLDVDSFTRNDQDRVRIRQLVGATPDDVVVTNVSALRHPKGMQNFVSAAIRLCELRRNVVCVLVGDGPQREELHKLVSEAGAQVRICFAGAQQQIAPWLSASDIGVLSSEAEGFSNSILEYMAAGLAIVATNVGGNVEALQGAGMLVPPRNVDELLTAILKLVDDAQLRTELGLSALQRAVSAYALPAAREKLLAYYRGLLSSAGVSVTERS